MIKSNYWKNISVVAIGTVLAQVLPILFLTVLSRLYSAEDVGVYVLVLSVASILVAISTLSLDQAMYVVKTTDEVRSLFRVLVIFSTLLLLLVFGVDLLVYFFFGFSVFPKGLESYTFEVVIFASLLAVLQGMYSWYIYGARFYTLSVLRVSVAGFVVLGQIVIIYMVGDLSDLIRAQILVTLIVVSLFILKERLYPFAIGRLKPVFEMLVLSKRFIYYSTPASIVNTLVNQLPIILIASNYSVAYSAFYGLANKMLTVPSSLLSGSIMTVFRDEAGAEYRANGHCMTAFKKTLKALILISVAPFFALYFLAEYAFVLVFGEEWRVAGQYARYLIPLVFMGFIVSPLSYTLLLAQWQGINLAWQILLLLLTMLIFLMQYELEFAIQLYSVVYSFMYCLYFIISYRAAKGS